MNFRPVGVLACACALPLNTHAVDLVPRGAFVEGGIADNATNSATVGLVWPWSWRHEALGGELTATTEAYLSHWIARGSAKHASFTQMGLLPVLRYRFGQGSSNWFAQGGVGISVMDVMYRTADKQFSTHFNFASVAALGRSFGPERRQELSLRLFHVSNADLKKPNPGENFLQLRYAAMF